MHGVCMRRDEPPWHPLAGMLDSSASPVVGWNLNTSAVLDLTATQNLAAYSKTAVLPQSTARLNGLLGGLGLSTVTPPNVLPSSGQYLPVISPDQGFQLAGATFGASEAWSWFLVWSRPNWRQGGSTTPIALMTVGSTPIVTLDSTPGVASNLRLFPSGANVVLSSTITRRHTHSLLLVNTPGTGVSAWLDGTQVASAVANPLTTVGTMTLLHDTTSGGGAQCWFHEAGYWTSALASGASGSVTTLLAWLTRWTLGARRGISLAVIGQSNGVNGYNAGAWHLMAQGVAWYLGALAGNVAGAPYSTLIGGLGIYPIPSGDPGYGLNGTFIVNPGDGSNPSGWALDTASGAMGVACQTQLSHQTKKYDLKSKHCGAQTDLGTTRAKVVEALTEVRRAKIDGPALIFDDQLCELHSSNTDASTSASSRSMPNVLGKDSDF